MTWRAVVVCAGCLVTVAGGPRAQNETFRTSAVVVLVDVSVRENGQPVSGLAPSDFTVVDDGRPQIVTSVSVDRMPIRVTVLVDTSESLDIYRDRPDGPGLTIRSRMADALTGVAASLESGDELQLLRLASDVRSLRTDADLGSQRPVHHRRTSLFDAVAAILMRRPDPVRRHLVVAATDGLDTSSALPRELLNQVLDRSEAVVHIVSTGVVRLASSYPTAGFAEYAWVLDDLTRRSGGRYYEVRADQDFSPLLRAAVEEFRTRYVVGFTPTGVDRPGWHELEVAVPGRSYEVRHRRGYWGG